MKLMDAEIIELTELCNALADGTLTGVQRARMEKMLAASEAARRYYVRYSSLSASLCQYAAEMQVEAPDALPATRFWHRPAFWWSVGPLVAAAAALIVFSVTCFPSREIADASANVDSRASVLTPELETQDYVAQLTDENDCKWVNVSESLEPGDPIECGRRLELEQGVAEITFDCGAVVTLEGPAVLELNSAWKATLLRGTLSAVVPHEAVGFRVSNSDVEVVDLGTEFSVVASAGSATEVYVHKGKVQTIPRGGDSHETPPILLTADQSLQFERGGSAAIKHGKPKFKAMVRRAQKKRPAGKIESALVTPGGVSGSVASPAAPRFANALKFDGKSDKQLPAHRLTYAAPHTVAFWMRVPSGVPLSAAGAMVAWDAGGGKSRDVPIHIAWNTDPGAGALGALRTEFGHEAVVGTTALRDGQWHHVAVVFVPHGRAHGKLHVKQYVDGRLEGSTTPSIPKHHREKYKTSAGDAVLLGRRLGNREHFQGELDELVFVNQAMVHQQIKQLIAPDDAE